MVNMFTEQEEINRRLAMTPVESHSDESTRAERRATCDTCPSKTSVLGVAQCGECGCLLVFKAAFKNAQCPKGKW